MRDSSWSSVVFPSLQHQSLPAPLPSLLQLFRLAVAAVAAAAEMEVVAGAEMEVVVGVAVVAVLDSAVIMVRSASIVSSSLYERIHNVERKIIHK
jgi:hypothetical protein